MLGYLEHINKEHLLVVINKDDLGNAITEEAVQELFPGAVTITTSLIGRAAEDAARQISEAVGRMHGLLDINVREMNIITSERHVRMLRNAAMNLDEAIEMLRNGEPVEVAELSARYAYDDLGKIIGEEAGDEIINTVFSRFCLGMFVVARCADGVIISCHKIKR